MSATDAKLLPRALRRVETGVPGLDAVLDGGLVERGLYVVSGQPGTGKTILANQIAFHRAHRGERVVFLTVLAEPHERMLQQMDTLSFADLSLVPERLSYMSAYGAVERDGLGGLLTLVHDTLTSTGPNLIVLDGLYVAGELGNGTGELRRVLYQLQALALRHNCLMLLLGSGPFAPSAPENTMVDGLIELTDELHDARSVRVLQVRKMRGGRHLNGRHVFRITENGVEVWPRLELTVRQEPPRPAAGTSRTSTGTRDLDRLLQGGVPEGSTTLVVGPSGSGKTTVGLLYIGQSTMDSPSVLFGCYEAPEELYLKAESVGVDLRQLVRSGAVRLLRYLPFESSLDEMGHALINAVRTTGALRVFIDGIGALEQSAIHASRLQPFFSALSLTLRSEGATLLCTAEARELFLPSEMVLAKISPVAENLILLRLAEHQSRLLRLVSVVKVRQSGFDSRVHPFEFDDDGLRLLPPIENVEEVIRGSSLHSIYPFRAP